MNIKKKIIKFVKYHNAFVVVMVLAMVGVGSVFANEDIRDAVIGEEVVVETKGLDNSAILACDLDAFDAMMQIIGVSEDPENYFVEYSYQTLAIEDNAWTEITRQEILDVSRASLLGRDLGIYLIEELGEIVESELAFLKEVQENELAKGETEIVETTDFTGLMGLLSDIIIKYKPEPAPIVLPSPPPVVAPVAPPEPVVPVVEPHSTVIASEPTGDEAISADDSASDPVIASEPAGDEAISAGSGDNELNSEIAASGSTPPRNDNDGGNDPPAEEPPADEEPPAVKPEPDLPAEVPAEPESEPEPEPILGCMDSTATNYNEEATEDDGSCEYPPEPEPEPEPEPILGCMDSTATNYNEEATEDDGSCEYPPEPEPEPEPEL